MGMIESYPYILDYGISPSCPDLLLDSSGRLADSEGTKICSKCKHIKSLDDFQIDRSRKDGKQCCCSQCISEYNRRWRDLNPEKQREKSNYYQETRMRWREANIEKLRANSRRWAKNHPEKQSKGDPEWRKKNPEKAKKIRKKANAKRRATPKGHLGNIISSHIRQSLKGTKSHRPWEGLIGYTVNDLKRYLEKQFSDGMSWDNYGLRGWHIDHIIPISVFNFEKAEDIDFKRCWALNNLRPLWATHNLKKGNKIDKQFQPSLIF